MKKFKCGIRSLFVARRYFKNWGNTAALTMLWALAAGATNITNYPVRTTFNANYWFLLSDVPMQTNWNLPGNYVASTADLNNLSNVVMNISNFTSITVTNPITNLSLTANTVVKSDANKALASIANGTGALTNNNAGLFGWYPGFASFTDLTNLSNSIITLLTNTVITNFSSITVTNPITNLSLTANTVVKADGNKALASIANGTGALTNNNSGVFGWYTYASLADITNTFNTLITTNRQIYYTNACAAPDFSKDYGWTNVSASFTAPLPINVPAGDQAPTFAWHVENSGGSPIQVSVNPSIDIVLGSVMWVTGRTTFTFHIYGRQFTNVYGVPNK